MELFWHRRDLRVADNVGLAAATGTRGDDRGPAAPVFVFDPDVLDHASDVRVRRLLDARAALREDYRDRGSDLLVARGDPEAVLPEVADDPRRRPRRLEPRLLGARSRARRRRADGPQRRRDRPRGAPRRGVAHAGLDPDQRRRPLLCVLLLLEEVDRPRDRSAGADARGETSLTPAI